LPVASIGSHEVLAETAKDARAGRGVCVGKPVEGVQVRVIRISDEPIAGWSDSLLVPPCTIGEITVRGPVVTKEYFGRPVQTAAAKIRDGEHVVHRMGDVGFLDERGRLWMCGRKGHRVQTPAQTWFSVPVEEVLNQHPAIKRTALVGVDQTPVILVERERASNLSDDVLITETRDLAMKHDVTNALRHFYVFPGEFPVDKRHNAKIEREKLAAWAKEKGLGR
jgi:acyl-CoA synthetase (AMP-forming)/AMP-acid ligase II